MTTDRLRGRTALVTGGSRGIGAAISRALAEAGAAVAINYRERAAEADRLAEALRKTGVHAITVAADVSQREAVERMVDRLKAEFGTVDILVNNAGINIRKPPHALSLAEWDSVINTNLTSAFLCSRAAYAPMKAAGGGKIINIGSMMSIFGVSFSPAYGPSKGGLVQLTKSLATAWAKDNIQVNAVLPGWIDTESDAARPRRGRWPP